jgi:hypothetical protein
MDTTTSKFYTLLQCEPGQHIQQCRVTAWTDKVLPAGAKRLFSLLHSVEAGSAVHPASYPMGAGGSFAGVKFITHLHLVPRSRMVEL